MKKVIATSLAVFALTTATFGMTHKFSDVNENSWYREAAVTLSEKNIVKGYPDGTFKPEAALNGDQFVAMVLRSVLKEDVANSEGYWAADIIERAVELGLIEIGDYRGPINREEMSSIIVKAMAASGETLADGTDRIKTIVADSELIDTDNETAVFTCYESGIITGYPDYRFGPKETLTRAEGSTIILRLIDKSKRVPFDYEVINKKINDPVISQLPGGKNYIDPLTVSLEENKRIDHSLMSKLVKVENEANLKGGGFDLLDHEADGDLLGSVYYGFSGDYIDYYKKKHSSEPTEALRLQYVKEQQLLFQQLLERRAVPKEMVKEIMTYTKMRTKDSDPNILKERVWHTDKYVILVAPGELHVENVLDYAILEIDNLNSGELRLYGVMEAKE